MEPTLKFQNQAAWEQDLQNIASVSGKAGDVVLHRQAALLVKDGAKFTPPTGKLAHQRILERPEKGRDGCRRRGYQARVLIR
jgi:hypothetical protein